MTNDYKVNVLDKGYVRMKPGWIMGYGDIEIVNDARTSFNKEVKALTEKDVRLIKFLAKHKHTSCFRGTACKVEMYAPLLTARQLWKYIIGAQHNEGKWQDSFTNWNESSRRYITEKVEFYLPEKNEWRSAPESMKQGSGDVLDDVLGKDLSRKLKARQKQSQEDYEDAMRQGVCAEQARLFLLSYGMYVRWRWTMSLQTLCHFISQRVKLDTQGETREYAIATYQIVKHFWEHGLKELIENEAMELLNEN